jgi:hypothetical protein
MLCTRAPLGTSSTPALLGRAVPRMLFRIFKAYRNYPRSSSCGAGAYYSCHYPLLLPLPTTLTTTHYSYHYPLLLPLPTTLAAAYI